MQIYISRNDEQFGPYSEADVRQYLASGELSPDDLAWHEGQAEWQQLSTIVRSTLSRPTRTTPSRPTPSRSATPLPPAPKPPLRRYAVIGVVVLYLISPYWSFWRLRSALDSGDRDSLESRIDFPSVRESIKDQLRIQVTKSMAKDNDLKDKPFRGLAIAFAPLMVNHVVDNLVTPSGISALIADSKSALKEPDSAAPSQTSRKLIDWSKVHYAFFTGPTQFTVDIDGTKLRFRFTGFGWELKKLEIPLNDAQSGTR